jgi:hypothetical protein
MSRPPISDEQIEALKNAFRNGLSVDAAAKSAGVSWFSANKFKPLRDQYESLRDEKRQELIAQTAAEYVPQLLGAIGKYIAHITKDDVIAETSAKDAMIVIGTAVDKVQLLTGKPTERSEHVDATDARDRLAHKIDELSARRAGGGNRESERA